MQPLDCENEANPNQCREDPSGKEDHTNRRAGAAERPWIAKVINPRTSAATNNPMLASQ
jgi:hypothetical protein